ncbi:hypothetical protein HBI25_013060 [Parastagonospora nodorum]|nr:hypothetical protein HBI10_110710 [Parastagonospora nodorum]KAH4022128.1 hypothetical protein HBI13_098510 [Parastagonospora nodorum]KAH4074328.1 hypothetical protein HBH50_045530 [Parastagonospora nodorum]KAH4082068.1 hypothetical protein HBH48_189510 [Parastagonospora nodorum]KAH4253950.1 hypothetical protein HBI03_190310 [Parastagonospora nodorum]
MNGRFNAYHNPAVVGLRTSKLKVMLIGYLRQSNDGTRAEVWAGYSWKLVGVVHTAELRLITMTEGDEKPVKWIEIAEFVPWLSQVKEKGDDYEDKTMPIFKNWLLLYPSVELDHPSPTMAAAVLAGRHPSSSHLPDLQRTYHHAHTSHLDDTRTPQASIYSINVNPRSATASDMNDSISTKTGHDDGLSDEQKTDAEALVEINGVPEMLKAIAEAWRMMRDD